MLKQNSVAWDWIPEPFIKIQLTLLKSETMATSLDALEALMQFHEGVFTTKTTRSRHFARVPVPNPLDPAQPHLIEGDTPPNPNHSVHRQAAEAGEKNGICSTLVAASVVHVPNPLMMTTPCAEITPVRGCFMEPVSTVKSSSLTVALCENYKFVSKCGPTHPPALPSLPTSCAASMLALGEHDHDRNDRLLDALKSLPQRGKKRQNLDEFERQELTRIRNREHAKSTRMRKKARSEELIEIEKNYLRLKELETLQCLRRQRLADFLMKPDVEGCPHYSRLHQLACQEFHEPEFSMIDSVALTTDNSGIVIISSWPRFGMCKSEDSIWST